MRYFFYIYLFFTQITICQNLEDDILAEGKKLYYLEKASWYGTDIFINGYSDLRNQIGGYLSYKNDEGKYINIFYNKELDKKIFQTEFKNNPNPLFYKVYDKPEPLNDIEKSLVLIRDGALKLINENKDNFFSFYQNTSLNLIPIIENNIKKVIVLTGPKRNGVVLLGNDYEILFDKDNKIISKKKYHNTLIPIESFNDDSDEKAIATMHSHVINDYIDATDICTLLLYKDQVEWKTHYVMSEKYVSIFDLENEKLTIMLKEDFEKLSKD